MMNITDEMVEAASTAFLRCWDRAHLQERIRAALTAALSGSPQVEAGRVERLIDEAANHAAKADCKITTVRQMHVGQALAKLKEARRALTRPREQEAGEAPVAWLKEWGNDEPPHTRKRLDWHPDTGWPVPSNAKITPLFAHPAPLPADGWTPGRLRDLVDIAVSWAYESPNYMQPKDADQLIAMVIAGKKPEYAAVARLDRLPTPPASTEAK